MKRILILLCLPLMTLGQNVNIPDANFKAYLVWNTAINTNGDTEIQVSEANSFGGTIYCDNMGISDLTGIEDFTNLEYLDCSYNLLTSIGLSQNTALTELSCSENYLTSLDVSQNIVLNNLFCRGNQLTSLDVSGATALTELYCSDNQLTSLDVSQNTALTELTCSYNQLTSLDVSNNTALTALWCTYNQLTSLDVRNGNNYNFYDQWGVTTNGFDVRYNLNLTCISVDDSAWSTNNWTVANGSIDAQQYFSNNCPPSALQEHTTNKELLRTIDVLGRETKNKPLFYIYDDGTVEKRITVE
jgi:Leucine-rich repeat (LRR) protein